MLIKISEEVKEALKNNKPVVALESTIISHGMPYPENVSTALKVEKTIREHGAIPATIAILNGQCVIGLSKEEIEEFGKKNDCVKVSRRDLPYVMAKKLSGGTTVAATMILAEKAGIKVFVTGGIGGVHRGATESFDISADLEELGKTNVCVVCAGAKAILDLGLTLEYLETKGVLVLGYQTNKLPAFYTKESKFNVDYKVDSAKDIADVLKNKWSLGLSGGVLVTNPVPEKYSMDSNVMESYIDQAIKEMNRQGIHGKNSTPYLLAKIKELSNGESLETNIALIINNAILGAEIAKEFYK